MQRVLSRLVNIQANEWPRLLLLYLMFFIVIAGCTWAETITEAAFLSLVGVELLPWFFIVRALVAIPAVLLYSAFADRVANRNLLVVMLLASAATVALGLTLLRLGLTALAYPLLYLIVFVPFYDIFAAHWYTYSTAFYDTRAAKRVVPVLGTASALASILAGLSMPLLNRLLAPSTIITLWALLLVVVAALAWFMPRILVEPASPLPSLPSFASRKAAGQAFANIREGYRFVAGSGYLRWLALANLMLPVLLTLLQYQASHVLLAELGSVARIANFLGLVTGIAGLVALPFQLLLLSRLIGRVGVGNANLLFPAGIGAITAALIVTPGIASAALSHVGRNTFYSIGYLIESLLYNAVPPRVRGRSRAFIGGLVVPIGALCGGLLLLAIIPLSGPPPGWLIPTLLGLAALGYLLCAIALRRHYGLALLALLEQEDLSFLVQREAGALSVADPAALAVLRRRLEASPGPELTIFVCTLISEVGGPEAIALLCETAARAPEARVRVAILDLLAAAQARGPQVRSLYDVLAADPDARLRRAALAGLLALLGPAHPELIPLGARVLEDPDPELRAQALAGLAALADFDALPAARAQLEALLASPDPARRARGLHTLGILGQRGDQRAAARLLGALADPDDAPRLQAVLALESFADGPLARLGAPLLAAAQSLLEDPVERARLAAVALLGRLPAALPLLAGALRDPSPDVREEAARRLAARGRAAVPLLRPLLDAPDASARAAALALLCRLDRRAYTPLQSAAIDHSLRAIYADHARLAALRPQARARRPGLQLLLAAIQARGERAADAIFELLRASHAPADIQRIHQALRRDDASTRANAVEALEALVGPHAATLIGPLFDPAPDSAELLRLGQQAWRSTPLDAAEALQTLLDPGGDPWLRAVATYSFGELPELALDPALADDPDPEVRAAAQAALRSRADRAGHSWEDSHSVQTETAVLSTIEKMIFLKEVPFFEGMTVDQLKVLASVCEELSFAADARIYAEGDPGDALYIVVSGRVAIEQERRRGSVARLETLVPRASFGEANLFDNSPHASAAVALEETLTLRLRREPLIALARRHPDLSLELIGVLSQRLREANSRIAELTRTRPREIHRLFDDLEAES
jgi:CRP-like cAMP-binding protein/ATP/ADP translocase/HEAT repeat protein